MHSCRESACAKALRHEEGWELEVRLEGQLVHMDPEEGGFGTRVEEAGRARPALQTHLTSAATEWVRGAL